MKKLCALALSLAMVFTLGACGNTASTKDGNDGTAENGNSAETTAKSDIKMGFICLHDENSTYDLNFINAAKEACDEMGVEYVIKTNIPEGQECYDAACELADSGCDIVPQRL